MMIEAKIFLRFNEKNEKSTILLKKKHDLGAVLKKNPRTSFFYQNMEPESFQKIVLTFIFSNKEYPRRHLDRLRQLDHGPYRMKSLKCFLI